MRRSLFALTVLLALALPACRTPDFVVFGYHAWWMGQSYERYDLGALDDLLFFELRVAADGSFETTNGWPERWQDLIARTHAAGSLVAPTLTLFDPARFDSLFTNPTAQAALLANSVAAVRAAQADGLHLDVELFEPVKPEARAAYVQFLRDLRRELGPGAALTVFTLALDPADAYDEAALAQVADYLVVQGYDLHHQTGPVAGPISALKGWGNLNWHAVVARYDALGIDRRQLVMATPFYGYEWPTTTDEPGANTLGPGIIISYGPLGPNVPEIEGAAVLRAAAFGLQRDRESGSPYYTYRAPDGTWRQGWFEDEQSLAAKFDFVKSKGLAGVALFPLGYDNGELQRVVLRAFPVTKRIARTGAGA